MSERFKALERHGPQPACERVRCFGRAGHVAGWNVLILGEAIHVGREADMGEGKGLVQRHEVPNYGTGIGELAGRTGFRLGWALMPDDAEILYFYDRDDGGFGYALNATDPVLSEWGYSPFRSNEAA